MPDQPETRVPSGKAAKDGHPLKTALHLSHPTALFRRGKILGRCIAQRKQVFRGIQGTSTSVQGREASGELGRTARRPHVRRSILAPPGRELCAMCGGWISFWLEATASKE